MGVATGITSRKQNFFFMTIIGLEVTRTTSDRTVANSKPLLLMVPFWSLPSQYLLTKIFQHLYIKRLCQIVSKLFGCINSINCYLLWLDIGSEMMKLHIQVLYGVFCICGFCHFSSIFTIVFLDFALYCGYHHHLHFPFPHLHEPFHDRKCFTESIGQSGILGLM